MRQLPESAPASCWLLVKLSRPLKVMDVTLSTLAGVFLQRQRHLSASSNIAHGLHEAPDEATAADWHQIRSRVLT